MRVLESYVQFSVVWLKLCISWALHTVNLNPDLSIKETNLIEKCNIITKENAQQQMSL